MNALIKEILETRPENGRVSAWWLGQMGLVLKKGKTTVMIDGFLAPNSVRLIPAPFTAEEACIFDAVIGTHNHDDHVDQVSWKKIHGANPNTVFIAPEAHREDIKKHTGIDILGADEGKTLTVGDFTIDAIEAAHEFIEHDAAGHSLHLSYIIDRRVFHAGDTLIYDGQRSKLRTFGRLSLMLLPINGRDAERYNRNCIGNMTFQEAVDLAGDMKPELALAGHFDMFPGNTEDPAKFTSYMRAKYPDVNCAAPEYFKRFDI